MGYKRGNWHIYIQRHYVMFGAEWDFDVDDISIVIHIWPLTFEWWKRTAGYFDY